MLDWSNQWLVLFLGMSLWMALKVTRRTHWSVGLFTLSVFIPTLALTFHPASPYNTTEDLVEKVLLGVGMRTALLSVLFTLPLLWVKRPRWMQILAITCVAGSIVVYVEQLMGMKPAPLGLTGSAGVSGTMIACTVPVLWAAGGQWPLILLTTVACLLSNSSMVFGVLGLVFLLWWVRQSLWALLILPVSLAAGHFIMNYHQSRVLFSTRGRTPWWHSATEWWWQTSHILFGSGVGSLNYYLPKIQLDQNPKAIEAFPWLHNDWLQVLVEQGVFGFACLLLMFFFTLKRAWARPWLFAAIAGYGGAAIGQFLPHGALSSVVGLGLLVITWRSYDQ